MLNELCPRRSDISARSASLRETFKMLTSSPVWLGPSQVLDFILFHLFSPSPKARNYRKYRVPSFSFSKFTGLLSVHAAALLQIENPVALCNSSRIQASPFFGFLRLCISRSDLLAFMHNPTPSPAGVSVSLRTYMYLTVSNQNVNFGPSSRSQHLNTIYARLDTIKHDNLDGIFQSKLFCANQVGMRTRILPQLKNTILQNRERFGFWDFGHSRLDLGHLSSYPRADARS